MKVTVRINEFKRVLEEALQVVKGKAAIPVLASVKVEVNSVGRATMSAIRLQKGLHTTIIQSFEAVDGQVGSFLLPAKQTREFLKGHVSGTATIETTPDGRAVIKTGTFTMNVECEPALHFPPIEAMPEVRQEISLKFLKKLVTRVESGCPEKPGRCTVPFVRLESDGKRLRAVGADEHRIVIAEALGDSGVFTTLLPKSFLPLIKRRAGSTVQFAESETSCFYRTDSVLLQCGKPTDIKFPPYERAYGVAFKGAVRLASADLRSVIVSTISAVEDCRPEVTLDVRSQNLQVSTTGRSVTTGSVKVFAVEGAPAATVRINPQFVVDFLAQAEGEITLHLPEGDKKMVKFSNGGNFQHFVMLRQDRPAEEAR